MKLKSRKGQTMVEYIIIVVLIAITLIALVGFFGKAIANRFADATEKIDAEEGANARQEADSIETGRLPSFE